MNNSSKMGVGSGATLPGSGVATLERAAIFAYQLPALPAIELAAIRLASRFGLKASRARTVAELAGMGGRP